MTVCNRSACRHIEAVREIAQRVMRLDIAWRTACRQLGYSRLRGIKPGSERRCIGDITFGICRIPVSQSGGNGVCPNTCVFRAQPAMRILVAMVMAGVIIMALVFMIFMRMVIMLLVVVVRMIFMTVMILVIIVVVVLAMIMIFVMRMLVMVVVIMIVVIMPMILVIGSFHILKKRSDRRARNLHQRQRLPGLTNSLNCVGQTRRQVRADPNHEFSTGQASCIRGAQSPVMRRGVSGHEGRDLTFAALNFGNQRLKNRQIGCHLHTAIGGFPTCSGKGKRAQSGAEDIISHGFSLAL